jgi:uncharacterized protein (TIGR02597 family)
MRRFLSLFAVLIATVSFASAQSVTTIPVGFTANAITPATGATANGTVVSVPFYAVADFQGAVSALNSTSSFSLSGAAFTPSPAVGDLVTVPHLARIKGGTAGSVGRFFKITANTATQVTVDTATAGYTLVSGAPTTTQVQMVVGDSVEIVTANTFGSLFGTTTGTVPFQQSGSVNTADNVYVWNKGLQNFDIYFFNNVVATPQWRKSGNGANQNTTVIFPNEGLFILRRGTTPLSLTFLGTVPSTTERTDYVGPSSSFVNSRFPIDMIFRGAGTNALNLQNLPSWLGSSSPNTADNVYLWNIANQNWDIYFFNSTLATPQWRKSGNGATQDSTAIPLGTAMFILRRSTATGTTSTLAEVLPYSL